MEGAHEVREVAEPDVEGDVGDRARVLGQQARRVAQAGAHQILVRRHAEHLREEPQEVERAEPGLRGRALEVDRLVRVRVDPERRLDRAAAIARRRLRRSPLPPGDDLDEAGREGDAQLVEADVRPLLGGRLRQLAEHHQLGQRGHAAGSPDLAGIADAFDQRRREPERQALVAARGGRACTCTRRPDGRPGSTRPPARTLRPGCGSRSCLFGRRRWKAARAARRTARSPGPALHR